MATENTPAKKPAAKKPATRRKPAARKPAAKKPEDLTLEELDALMTKKLNSPEHKDKLKHLESENTGTSGPGPYDITSPTGRSEDKPDRKFSKEPAPIVVPLDNPSEHVPAVSTAVTPTLFIRNLRNTPVSYRLARQESPKRRTDLKPRGMRGDIVKLEDGDIEDPAVVDAVSYGLIEIITSSEASTAIQKQSINQQQSVHPAYAHIRNEKDEAYEPGSVKVQAEGGATGIVVGQVATPNPVTGDGKLGRGGADSPISRPGEAPVGVSQLPNPVQQGEEANLAARDALARAAKQPSSPLDALGLSLSVAPTQQS